MKYLKSGLIALSLLTLIYTSACTSEESAKTQTSEVEHPEWSKNANIYEVNIRQYSPEGTFNAFREDLPRLQEMGVKILWLMPIHPIGEENRKGSMGSYYAVKDYKAVNPEFGTEEDFQALVDEAHELGMKVIIDWVANHTAWDNVWAGSNPEWFTKDPSGNFTPPIEDWSDVIDLDYENEEMSAAMLDAMKYWVREFDIDGYRCDVAGMVPVEFWNLVREELDAIKPVFMLAEDEGPEMHHKAFDMTYAWTYAHTIREIAAGNAGFDQLDSLMEVEEEKFPDNAYRMYFTTNHDENSWTGSDPDMYGDNFENFAVLSATIDGMPLIYNGQESGLDKQLEFFEKDEIEWGDYKYQGFYKSLLTLNRENEALWNGEFGGDLEILEVPEEIYAYKRVKGENEITVVLNFSDEEQSVALDDVGVEASLQNYGSSDNMLSDSQIEFGPNQWIIFVKN